MNKSSLKHHVRVVIFLGLCLSGCSFSPSDQPKLTSAPTDIPISPTNRMIVTNLPSTTPTKKINLTGTHQPTQIIIKPSSKPIAFCGSGFSLLSDDEKEDLNDFAGLVSPDGNFIAMPCENINGGSRYTSLKVNRFHGEEIYEVIFDQSMHEKFRSEGFFFPKHWSSDGRFLYYAPYLSTVGGNGLYARDGHALLRLDMLSGETTEILPVFPDYPHNFYAFSFSPDEKWLVYIPNLVDQSLAIHITSFNQPGQIITTFDPKFCSAGDIIWSPDDSLLLILAWKCGPEYGYWGLYSLVMVNVADKSQEILFERVNPLYPIGWDAEGPVVEDYENKKTLHLNLESLELTEIKK